MFVIIIGKNAQGKSIFLRDKMEDGLYSNNYLSNIDLSNNIYYNSIGIDLQKIEALEDILIDADIKVKTNNGLSIEGVQLSEKVQKLLELMCKSTKRLYIDEPEFGLNSEEVIITAAFLNRISIMYDELYIVTHSRRFGLLDADKLCVINKEFGKLSIKEYEGNENNGYID